MEKMLFSLHLNKPFSDWFLVSVSYITEYSMRFILSVVFIRAKK